MKGGRNISIPLNSHAEQIVWMQKNIKMDKVHKTKSEDITKTAGYKEAMDDIKHGRVTEYASLKEFYKEIGL